MKLFISIATDQTFSTVIHSQMHFYVNLQSIDRVYLFLFTYNVNIRSHLVIKRNNKMFKQKEAEIQVLMSV